MCIKYGTAYLKTPARLKVGISENVKKGGQPVHGLRHEPEGETRGWYDKNLLKVSSKNDKKLDQLIEITRKVVAKDDIKDYLPTLYLVKRHHIIANRKRHSIHLNHNHTVQ